MSLFHKLMNRAFIVLSSVIIIGLLAAAGGALANYFGENQIWASLPTPFPTAIFNTATPRPGETPSLQPPTELPPTSTRVPTRTLSPTPGPSPTSTNTPTITPTPTDTSTPTITPTSLPQHEPTLMVTGVGIIREGFPTPATAIPTPVPTYDVPEQTTNILLVGSDTPLATTDSRSDTIIIVSINRSAQTASMLSLPRDLFVYIPNKTMNRLNVAYLQGGVDLLKQTILYNFGIPIHYYARIDFAGFKGAVDAMGGVDLNVSCGFHDWRLISPELDPELEESWEQFTLEPGVHHMDGDLALWYARSRLSSNDFDRSRRQQQLLRAMLNQGVDLGLVAQAPTLWNTYKESVETDLDIGRLLQLAASAPAIRENGVQHLYPAGKTESWVVPTTGAMVQLPVWEGEGKLEETVRRLFLPPALTKTTRPPIFVEIINATDNPDMSSLAADNLAWYGFVPVIGSIESYPQFQGTSASQLKYYAPNFKGSYDWLISWIAGVFRSKIELISDDDSYPYDYQLILGDDYDPCVNPMYAPQIFLDQ